MVLTVPTKAEMPVKVAGGCQERACGCQGGLWSHLHLICPLPSDLSLVLWLGVPRCPPFAGCRTSLPLSRQASSCGLLIPFRSKSSAGGSRASQVLVGAIHGFLTPRTCSVLRPQQSRNPTAVLGTVRMHRGLARQHLEAGLHLDHRGLAYLL